MVEYNKANTKDKKDMENEILWNYHEITIGSKSALYIYVYIYIYIMGDFNLDLLNTDLHSATNEFINALFSHFLYPLISRPTRLTSSSD